MKSEKLIEFEKMIEEYISKQRISKKKRKEINDLNYWFVTNCPAKKGPDNVKKFIDYGFDFNKQYSEYKNKVIKELSLANNKTYVYYENPRKLENDFSKVKDFFYGRKRKIVMFQSGESRQIDTLFIRLRNSFAHGNYFKIGDYYIMWNVISGRGNKPDTLGAFFMLKYDDLKKIFELLGELPE